MKSGAWYSYKDAHIGQGKEKARSYLHNNPDVAEELEAQIRGADKPAEEPVEAASA